MPGPTMVAIFSFGVQPTGMKNAVSRPHAMTDEMLGMIMFEQKVTNFWMWMRTEVRSCGGAVAVTMLVLSDSADAAPVRPVVNPPGSLNVFISVFACLRQGLEAN